MSTEQNNEGNNIKADPVITYNHMDDDASGSFLYFRKNQPATGIPVWSVVIEEILIVLLFLALITISFS